MPLRCSAAVLLLTKKGLAQEAPTCPPAEGVATSREHERPMQLVIVGLRAYVAAQYVVQAFLSCGIHGNVYCADLGWQWLQKLRVSCEIVG
jgi:hypothetical protein